MTMAQEEEIGNPRSLHQVVSNKILRWKHSIAYLRPPQKRARQRGHQCMDRTHHFQSVPPVSRLYVGRGARVCVPMRTRPCLRFPSRSVAALDMASLSAARSQRCVCVCVQPGHFPGSRSAGRCRGEGRGGAVPKRHKARHATLHW